MTLRGQRDEGERRPHVVVVGDALLDRDLIGDVERVSPEAPVPVFEQRRAVVRAGGAALAAAMCAADGLRTTLIVGVAGDDPGRELREEIERRGVALLALARAGDTVEKVRVRAGEHPLLRIDRGVREAEIEAPGQDALAAIAAADGVLVSDYGCGVSAEPALRAALAEAAGRVPVVWDPHPLGAEPVPGVRLVTPNEREVDKLRPGASADVASLAAAADSLATAWAADHVCVTRGAGGALLASGSGSPTVIPTDAIGGADTCGAGDRFASRAAGTLAAGGSVVEAIAGGVEAATELIRGGGILSLDREPAGREAAPAPVADRAQALVVAAEVRASGGTVVATGGCFDLLHAGHVRTLEGARALGDCLIVCLNSDESVRRLKGPGRPLVPEGERAAVLAALGCVDAVAVFDEDTPAEVLADLRPHVWAKGGDYAGGELPETAVVESWGGRSVLLPYVAGRSTSGLIENARAR